MSVTDVALSKSKLRSSLPEATRAAPLSDRRRWSALICQHILSMEVTERASGVALYRNMRSEAKIDSLIETLIARGKSLYFPRVDGPGAMSFRAWRPGEPFVRGPLGAREPSPEAKAAEPGEIQLFLVPGLAFDRCGVRLGRGAAYYDRTLPRFRMRATFLGVCYGLQFLASLPSDSWDCRMDGVVTEAGPHVVGHASADEFFRKLGY